MAGFVGYLLNEKVEFMGAEQNSLEYMGEKVSHRGSNDLVYYADGHMRLGFCTSHPTGKQALISDNERYQIVFDGEIYNTQEIREKLRSKGYLFNTESSIEVLLFLYIERGEKALEEIRGVFSFLIWDKQEKELFGARDRFGMKPFYLFENNVGLYFSSELKSLYDVGDYELNIEALQHYFSFQYVPEPETTQVAINKLEPGHYFYKKPNEAIEIKAYWKPSFTKENYSFETQVKRIREVLQESVALHMQSDKSVGAFLSGGVDSTAIVALAKEINPLIQTVTVGFECEGYSEIDIAKETARQLNVENHHYVISPEEFIRELPNVVKFMDDPVADPASVPLYIAAREAKKHMDIVLSGEGADELFGGYNIYREPDGLKMFTYVPKSLQTILRKLAAVLPEGMRGKSFLERGTTPLESRFIGNAKLFSEKEKRSLLSQYHSAYHYKKITDPLYGQIVDYPDVHKMQYIDLHTWLRGDILVKVDRMTMAHSLELRTPFLDHAVYNVAAGLLPKHKIAKGTTKYVLREAVRGIVPDSVLYNKKLGFPVPIRHWLRAGLYEWTKAKISGSPVDYLIDKSYVLRLVETHKQGKLDYSRKIWAVLVFIIWHEQYMEK